MPCGNLDHEHPPWPQQGAHEFVIEACENHCGWCGYRTKMANNLRVHARRHLTNENETRLSRIKIVKGKAGRKKVQMAKRRFPGSGACDEKPGRSPSVEFWNNGMNPDQPGNDWEENRRRENPGEAPYPPPSTFTPHLQIPPTLHNYQDEGILLNEPPRTRNEQLQLPLPIPSMDVSSPTTNGHRIPNENETRNAHSSSLSFRAINSIGDLVLRPLVDSKYEIPDYYSDKIVFRREIICLRDLENDLLRIPNNQSWNNRIAKKLDFSLLVIRCIKNTVPFLQYSELVRPHDQPYDERYFTEVEASLKARYQLPEVARDKESGFNREVRQEQREELPSSIETLHAPDTRMGNISMIPEHRLGERRGPQERDMNENVLGIVQSHPWSSSYQRSIQEAAYLPGDSTQNGTSQHPNRSLPGPVRSSLKDLGYSETELDEISRSFNINIWNQHGKTQVLKLSIHALNRIHKTILLPLLRRPSLQKFKTSVLACAANINTPGFENLRAIETVLLSAAHVGAESPISYLRFCNYLFRCIRILIREDGSLNDKEKTCRDQSTYSEAYFAKLLECIHKEADRKRGLSEWPECKTWRCPESQGVFPQCIFRHRSPSKSYLIVHLQEYHDEDVGCTCEEELAGRALDRWFWRCRNCLVDHNVYQYRNVCWNCKVPCEEFRIKARAKLSLQENGIDKIQQDSPSAHPSTIASSQSFEQGETPSLDTPKEHRSQTLQPHISLPEPVTTPRDASNAALELPVSTMASKPTSSENRHQDGIVMAFQSSGSYVFDPPLFCVGVNCRFRTSTTLPEFQLHLDKYHKALVKVLAGELIYQCQELVRFSDDLRDSYCGISFATMSDLLKHQGIDHLPPSRYKQGTSAATSFNLREVS